MASTTVGTEAIDRLIDEHLDPAWRIAVVAAPNEVAARAVTARAFVDGALAAQRTPDPTCPTGVRIVAAVRRAAADASELDLDQIEPRPTDPVLVAFRTLPERSRTALWLVEVEGATPEQVAPILGLGRSESAALAQRASTALRDRLATDLAAAATDVECRRALGRLGALAAANLTTGDRTKVEQHLAGCGTCGMALASLVTPHAALRRAVPPLPAAMALAVREQWAELVPSERDSGLTV